MTFTNVPLKVFYLCDGFKSILKDFFFAHRQRCGEFCLAEGNRLGRRSP